MDEETILRTYEEKRKQAGEFNLTSDLFAGKVFEDREACQELCRILLKNNKIVIKNSKTKYAIRNLEKGRSYCELPDVTLVFITKEDFIGDKRGHYEFPRKADGQDVTMSLDNGLHEICFNLEYYTEDAGINELLNYFKDSAPHYQTRNFPRIVERVRYFKIQREGVNIMCEIADRIRKEGIKEGIIKSLKSMIKNANMPLEQAMAVLEIPEKDRAMYAGEIGKIL